MRALLIGIGLVTLSTAGCDKTSNEEPAPRTDALLATDSSSDADTAPADPDTESPPNPALTYAVDKAGPFSVGYRSFPITYTPPGYEDARTVDIHLWYPTENPVGEHPTYEFLFLDEEAWIDAPIAAPASEEGYPVHVYSHGHMGFGGSSYALMRFFASHGWLAIAPDHTGNTLSDNISPRPASIYVLRSHDISAALNTLESLPTEDPVHGKALTDGVVLSGHSFGTHTCWASAGGTFDVAQITAACAPGGDLDSAHCTDADLSSFETGLKDERVLATIPMAGGLNPLFFGETGHESVEIPILLMTGSEDPVGGPELFEKSGNIDMTWIDIEGACHQTFGLGTCELLSGPEGYAIINTYAMAFARRHVQADPSPEVTAILDGSQNVSTKVQFQKK